MANFVGTSEPLAQDTEWISPTRLRERHDTVTGSVYSDLAGELYVEQSMDGTFDNEGSDEVDHSTKITVSASTGKEINVILYAPYWRVRYVNPDVDDQSVFRLQVTTQAGGDS